MNVEEHECWRTWMLKNMNVEEHACWGAWMLRNMNVEEHECWRTWMLKNMLSRRKRRSKIRSSSNVEEHEWPPWSFPFCAWPTKRGRKIMMSSNTSHFSTRRMTSSNSPSNDVVLLKMRWRRQCFLDEKGRRRQFFRRSVLNMRRRRLCFLEIHNTR